MSRKRMFFTYGQCKKLGCAFPLNKDGTCDKCKDIAVLIIEDEELFKKIVHEYFGEKVTYAARFKIGQREKIVELLDNVR